jgi:hypothetical protein
MSNLDITIDNVQGDMIPNLARFAHYIGVVAQINGSLIESVTINGHPNMGPEVTSADGLHLTLGARALPPMYSVKPVAIAAWCGAALHGFAHSRYSPRCDEPLRGTLQKKHLHRTWNMIEDARIERLLLRDFPGWQPHLMGACNHILLTPRRGGTKPDLVGVYPLIVGRTYLPAALRQESYEAFAEEHSEYIADAVRDLVFEYLTVVDPGSEDHDQTVSIVSRLHALIGDCGTDCGSHEVEPDVNREWTDPGDPEEDESDEVDPDADDGNHEVTDDDDEEDDDGEDGQGEPCDDGDDSDEDGDGDDGDGEEESDDDGEGDAGGDGDPDDDDADGDGTDDDGDTGPGRDDEHDDEGDDDEGEGDGSGVGGAIGTTSRLAEWSEAIDSALAQDQRLNDVAEAVQSGPMPLVRLAQREVQLAKVPFEVQAAELDIARELRVLMDGARPGMKRRIDRGRFNVARVVREGGTTRPEEMFDRHDPGAVRATGCAVTVLADVSGSMSERQLAGAMYSVWSIDRAVQSVRGAFQGYTFGYNGQELPRSTAEGVWVPTIKDGNTNPVAALASAQAWLSQQREPNKLCIVATDGAWDGHSTSVETLNSMIHSGVQVAIFGIQCQVTGRFPSHFNTIDNVDDASQIGPAIGAMLVNRVRKSLRR